MKYVYSIFAKINLFDICLGSCKISILNFGWSTCRRVSNFVQTFSLKEVGLSIYTQVYAVLIIFISLYSNRIRQSTIFINRLMERLTTFRVSNHAREIYRSRCQTFKQYRNSLYVKKRMTFTSSVIMRSIFRQPTWNEICLLGQHSSLLIFLSWLNAQFTQSLHFMASFIFNL